MNTPSCSTNSGNAYNLRFMDGTKSHKGYAVVARRGNVFLGIKLSGLLDGSRLGLPGKTYLSVRVRSAWDQGLAEQLDGEGSKKVVSLFEQQIEIDQAWPKFTFEKVDSKRASLIVGLFIGASLNDDPAAVINRIEQGDLGRKLVDYVIQQAGPEHCIARPKMVAAWLLDELNPVLDGLEKSIVVQKAAQATQKEFAAAIEDQLEVAGAYGLQLNAIFNKHKQAQAVGAIEPSI